MSPHKSDIKPEELSNADRFARRPCTERSTATITTSSRLLFVVIRTTTAHVRLLLADCRHDFKLSFADVDVIFKPRSNSARTKLISNFFKMENNVIFFYATKNLGQIICTVEEVFFFCVQWPVPISIIKMFSRNNAPLSAFFKIYFLMCCESILLSNGSLDLLWNEYKIKFNKTYATIHELSRRDAWIENMKAIESHNTRAGNGTYSYLISVNHLTDLSPKVYLQKMAKLTKSTHRKIDPELVGNIYEQIHGLPEEIDWREKGFSTPTFNQKDCGSCYAFSIACVIQAQIFKQTNKSLPLSEQQMVDCSTSAGNYGCSGGSLRNTLKYLDKTGGLMAFDDYPYTAKQTKCQYDADKAMVKINSWKILPPRNENALQNAVAKIGPVAVSVNASPRTFQLYHKGIYDDPACASNVVNHAMLLVGYTKDAWILKNWWGGKWGENGYMKLRRNKNLCGVSNFAAYALI